jgi:hypothetical protein
MLRQLLLRDLAVFSVGILAGLLAGCAYGWARHGAVEYWPYLGAVLGGGAGVICSTVADLLRPIRRLFRPRPPDDAEPLANHPVR